MGDCTQAQDLGGSDGTVYSIAEAQTGVAQFSPLVPNRGFSQPQAFGF